MKSQWRRFTPGFHAAVRVLYVGTRPFRSPGTCTPPKCRRGMDQRAPAAEPTGRRRASVVRSCALKPVEPEFSSQVALGSSGRGSVGAVGGGGADMARGARAARGCATGSRRRGRDRAETDAGEGLHRGRAGRCSFEARSAETRSLEEVLPLAGIETRGNKTSRIGRAGSLEIEATTEAEGARSDVRRVHPPAQTSPQIIGGQDIVARAGSRKSRGEGHSTPSRTFSSASCLSIHVRPMLQRHSTESSARPRCVLPPAQTLTNNPKRRERPSPSPPSVEALVSSIVACWSIRPRATPIDRPLSDRCRPPAERSNPSTGRLTWARAGSG